MNSGFKGKCYKCHKVGHRADKCYENQGKLDTEVTFMINRKDDNYGDFKETGNWADAIPGEELEDYDVMLKQFNAMKERRNEMSKVVCQVNEEDNSRMYSKQWIMDSGSTNHICNDRNLFNQLKETNIELSGADNITFRARGIGDITLYTTYGKCNILNVLYVPAVSKNIVSVGLLQSKGAKFELINGKMMGYIFDKQFINATLQANGLYYIDQMDRHINYILSYSKW